MPLAEGAAEGADLGIAEQEGDVADRQMRLTQIQAGEIAADPVHQIGERDAVVAEAPLQGPAG